MTVQTTLLSAAQLNKTYTSKGRTVRALEDVSLDLGRGEILGVVGESGSGKSTLLRILSGIERPDGGRLSYKGREYTGQGPEKTGRFLQMIFQDAYGSFDPRMTMARSLLEGGGADREDLLRITRALGLTEDLLSRRPGTLSGGQCQRMSIARALLSQAEILLCDEITSALDVTVQAQVIRTLLRIREEEGVSILFVSHDLALVSMICDRIMVMKEGRVVDRGETARVIDHPASDYTRRLLEDVMTLD